MNINLKARYDTKCCLLLIDVDDFKKFNDTYGHKAGDDVLKQVANILLLTSRNTDICARWGGEEFAVLCPETTVEEACKFAKRFQKSLARESQGQIAGTTIKLNELAVEKGNQSTANESLPLNTVTCSVGIAELSKNSNEASWFNNADSAMYAAKAKGKNSIVIHTS